MHKSRPLRLEPLESRRLLTGQIQGVVWNDWDADGQSDAEEYPMAGVTVFLDTNRNGLLDQREPTVDTAEDAPGQYSFTDLAAGTYTVVEVLPDGWQPTHPNSASRAVELLDGQTAIADFGNRHELRLQVIASSIGEGDVVPAGQLTYTVGFNRVLSNRGMHPWDMTLEDQEGTQYPVVGFNHDAAAATVSVEYEHLPEGDFTLTIHSGIGQIEGLHGEPLDGEPDPIDLIPSGNGVPGGPFAVHFSTEVDVSPAKPEAMASFSSDPMRQGPRGSLILEQSLDAWIRTAGDIDAFTFDPQDAKTLTLAVQPEASLQPTLELRDPDGNLLASAAASAPGERLVLQAVPAVGAGTYTVVLGGESGTTGKCVLRLVFNAAIEQESSGEQSNDEPATAQDLDSSFIAIGPSGMQRGAVLGSLPPSGDARSDDWYRFTLLADQPATLALQGAFTQTATLDLYDGQGNLLAQGAASSSTQRAIARFTAAVSGTYFARISGIASSGYDSGYGLVITRGGVFDVESANPQDITATGTALGAVGPKRDDETFTFAVFGDYGHPSYREDAVARMVKSWQPDFIVTTGDNNYGGLDVGHEDWTDMVGEFFGEFIQGRSDNRYPEQTSATQRFFPSVGNHDSGTPGVSNGSYGGTLFGYLDYFHYDPADPTGGRLRSGVHTAENSYYDFRVGPMHFFAIDTDHASIDPASAAAQREWLKTGLANSTAPWKFVTSHLPPYSSGRHLPNPRVQWPYQAWGADALLAGHNHSYERILRDDMLYFVSGLGGGSIYSFSTADYPGLQARYNEDYGSMKVTLTGNEALFEFFSIDDGNAGANGGRLIDSFTFDKPIDTFDEYTIAVNTSDMLVIETSTPGDSSTSLGNSLDPIVELFDPDGILVAENDNGGPDRRNARLIHEADIAGTYTVRVRDAGDQGGEYVLRVEGATGTPDDPYRHPGDANLDGVTDVRDFMIWNTHKFTSPTDWESGDFNGDGITDVRDFMVWNTHKFTKAPGPAPAPEPVDLILTSALQDALLADGLGWLDERDSADREEGTSRRSADTLVANLLATYWLERPR